MSRASSLLPAVAAWVFLSAGGAAHGKPSLADWSKARTAKVLTPAEPPPAAKPGKASEDPRASKAEPAGPALHGRIAVMGFKGEGAGAVHREVVSVLRAHGLHVTTGLRPVDSAGQFREMAGALNLAAYIDGAVSGAGAQGRATISIRSGASGRYVAALKFTAERGPLTGSVGRELWPRAAKTLARACADAGKPRKRGRGPMRINAGTQIEDTPRETADASPRGGKADPWADDGT